MPNSPHAASPNSEESPLIQVEGLVKDYGRFRALDRLNLHVHAGEVHGFLGPNGSGKSTTIRVLLGLLLADEGTARVFGLDPQRDGIAIHRRLAYVPGDVNLWPGLTGGEVIDVLSRMRGPVDPARRRTLIERFELDPSKRTRTYSKGNRQKVALVAAFASDPELLILDEPTSGLDPLMENAFVQTVAEATHRGATVLLSSHILSEVEKLADQVTIIRDGRTVQSGALDDLRRFTRTTVDATTTQAVVGLEDWPGVSLADRDDAPVQNAAAAGHRSLFSVGPDHLDETMRRLADHGITALTSTPPALEDLFMEHYRADAPNSADRVALDPDDPVQADPGEPGPVEADPVDSDSRGEPR